MGNTIIKKTASFISIGSASKLYRIGNLRILQVNGTPPHNETLPAQDRPSATVSGSAVCNTSDGNLYCGLGKISIATSGAISCVVATVYYSGSAGYSVFTSGVMSGTVVWTV